MTSYRVLRRLPDNDQPGDDWHEAGPPVESVSAEAAIRKAADKPGTYVAIPLRSFKQVKVTIHTPSPVIKLA